MKKRILIILPVLLVVLLAVAGCLYFFNLEKNSSVPSETSETSGQVIGSVIEYNGEQYIYNSDITNILILGVDTEDPLNEFSETSNAGQSDAIYILSINRSTNESFIIQVNRNTMTDIDIYNDASQVEYTIPGQVTLQYAYGVGGTQSCWAAKKTISEMLFDLPLNSYFTMNISGISEINDLIGGVDVELTNDYTEINGDWTAGSTTHLEGEEAERFVRYRDINVFNSVEGRMERQVIYIKALFDKLSGMGAANMYDMLSPYFGDTIITNLETDDFELLSDINFESCPVYTLDGETEMGERYEEFYLDEDAMQEFVISHYYYKYN